MDVLTNEGTCFCISYVKCIFLYNICRLQALTFNSSVRKQKQMTPVGDDMFEMQPAPNNDDDESEMDDYFDDV